MATCYFATLLLCYLILDTYYFAIWLHADNPSNVDNTKIKTNTTTGGGAKTQFCTRHQGGQQSWGLEKNKHKQHEMIKSELLHIPG